jgi:hypothetical protein
VLIAISVGGVEVTMELEKFSRNETLPVENKSQQDVTSVWLEVSRFVLRSRGEWVWQGVEVNEVHDLYGNSGPIIPFLFPSFLTHDPYPALKTVID